MQKLLLAAFAAAPFVAAPAFAQSSTQPSTNNTNTSSENTNTPMHLQQIQQKITKDLSSDGYQDIHIIPDSFLVHAKNKQGDPVVMIINPDSVFSVTKMPNQANAGNPSGTSGSSPGLGNSPNSTTNSSSATKQ